MEQICLVPYEGALRVEVRDELAGILRLTEAARNRIGLEGVVQQINMVAGTGFEPVTFRL